MRSSFRAGDHRDVATRTGLDETILVWNGVVTRTERSPKPARRTDSGVEDAGGGGAPQGPEPIGGDRRTGMTAER
jgi:hypothetical protein